MSGAQLLGLQRPAQILLLPERVSHPFTAVAIDNNNLDGVQFTGPVKDVTEQRLTGEGMQDLRQVRLHPRSLAGGQDHDTQ
jgi:hypothetical protein